MNSIARGGPSVVMSTFEAFCQALLRGGTEYQIALKANQAIVATKMASQFNSPKKSKIIASSS
jgi:hypothetical protein